MNGEARNIFYTDDDKDDRDIFTEAAREISTSLQIITQDNGDELMKLLKNPPPFPSVIFLDLNMPVKNGYEVLKEIKQSEHKDIPVIIFSTADDERSIETTRQLGANLYIPKPALFSSLKNAIRHTLSINWETFRPSGENFVYRAN